MKATIFTLLATFLSLIVYAQNNSITINLKNSSVKESHVNLNPTTKIKFTECGVLKDGSFIKIQIIGTGGSKTDSVKCSDEYGIDLKEILGTGDVLVITVKGEKEDSTELKIEVKIDSTGKIDNEGNVNNQSQPEKIDTVNYVDPSFLVPSYSTCINCTECRKPAVIYDPCCNRYKIIDEDGKPATHLRYFSLIKKNHGVVFLIKNFNMLQYDVSVNNEYANANTEQPELFSVIAKAITSGNTPASSTGKKVETPFFLQKLIKLNQDLVKYVRHIQNVESCSNPMDFEAQKLSISQKIKLNFWIKTEKIDLLAKYDAFKMMYIDSMVADGKPYTAKSFNEDFTMESEDSDKKLGPDDLASAVQKMITLLVTTKYEYQFNVPQLQNADKIIFNVSVAPKEGSNGPIHMKDEPIAIPIHRGWKMDFSTGFYYSSLRNESYSLRDIRAANDSLTGKWIVPEDSTQSGRGAIGVSALMHIYPRWGQIQPAFTLGVGATSELNYSLLVGGGIIIGKENRFIISGGLNYSSVKVLSEKYYLNGIKMVQSKDVTAINTYNKIKTGWFVGVSYSLGLGKKSQAPATEKKESK